MNQEFIKAICNPTRLKIIRCLEERDKSVSELIDYCDLAQSAVSQHLAKLKKANIVETTREGKVIKYSLIDSKYAKVSKILLEISEE